MDANINFKGLRNTSANAVSLKSSCCCSVAKVFPTQPLTIKIKDPVTQIDVTKDVLLQMNNSSLTTIINGNNNSNPLLDFGLDTSDNALCIQQLFGMTEDEDCVVLHLNVLGIPFTFSPNNGTFVKLPDTLLIQGSHKFKLCATDTTSGSEEVTLEFIQPFVIPT